MRFPDGQKIRLDAAVGAAIQKRRQEAGMSRRVFGDKIQVSANYLQKIESGETTCPLLVLYRAALVFDVTLDDLVPVLTEVA